MKKIGILGSGTVGDSLTAGFVKHGYEVARGSREPAKLEAKRNGAKELGTFADAAKFGDIVVLAVKGEAAESVLELAGADNLAGKTIIDTTNPIGGGPPANGVIHYFTNANESLMERLQKKYPKANFVKAFNSVGNAFMVNPDFGGQKPSMFICGNEAGAKAEVKTILDQFGWEVEDMGKVEAARPIESLCILWCIPGFLENRWSHAFKLLKK